MTKTGGGEGMSFLSYFRSVAAKIVTVPIITFVLGLVIPGILGYQLLQHGAERETHAKALTSLELLSAVQHYTEEESGTQSLSGKDSAAHPGTFVTQQVMQRYDTGHHEEAFRYRQVALNPTDPRNQADEYESRLIHGFEANPQTAQAEEEIRLKGQGYHILAVPIVASQDRCLRCHGSPKGAPAWRLKEFGKTAGFGWKKGQVVGANIVYMPSDFPRRQAALAFWSVAKSVGILALMCAVMLFLRAHFLIMRPVKRMLATSQAIQNGEWEPWSEPHFPDELATLGNSFQMTTAWLRDKIVREEKLRALFQQFIPASVAAKALGKDADEILVGTRHSVTVMIINIRNFKLLMDHLPPDQTVTTLNEYFSEVNKIIVANKGLVSKFMGDSVMALFGMPLDKENHALSAVRAALSIPAALQNLYVRLDEKYGWELGVGIGISTGEPIVGSFGSSEHREYSVLGDVVGEAHLLEAATKAVPEEDSIIISEATYRNVMSEVHVFDLGEKPGVNGAALHAYVVQGFRNEVRSSLAA
jgi:class 3 adenylate cyclase